MECGCVCVCAISFSLLTFSKQWETFAAEGHDWVLFALYALRLQLTHKWTTLSLFILFFCSSIHSLPSIQKHPSLFPPLLSMRQSSMPVVVALATAVALCLVSQVPSATMASPIATQNPHQNTFTRPFVKPVTVCGTVIGIGNAHSPISLSLSLCYPAASILIVLVRFPRRWQWC